MIVYETSYQISTISEVADYGIDLADVQKYVIENFLTNFTFIESRESGDYDVTISCRS